jgi:hypothetical protein
MSRELVWKSRAERKRKLLPNLKLTYPNDLEMEQIAKFAEVDDTRIFADHIRSIILDAHWDDASWRNLSIPKVREALDKVVTRAQALAGVLHSLDVDAKASAELAGRILEIEMGTSPLEDRLVLIPDFIRLLNWLSKSASEAVLPKSTRGPKGAGGNRAFDLFIQNLLVAAWQRRGNWTISRSADGTWGGSLPKALKLLKPYLPHGFFPAGELGRSVEHVRKKFMDYITKNQTSPS